MKPNSIKIIFYLSLLFFEPVHSQVRLGIKGGISTYDLGVDDALNVLRNGDALILQVQNARYGFHGGLVLQLKFASFVLQPEIVFNSNSVDYSFGPNGSNNPLYSEKYQYLDFPVMMGLKAGPMRLMAGPVGHYFLESSSEFFEFEDYDQKFSDFTYGWQAGIGIDFLNIMVDIRYEGNFYKFGDHIVFGGEHYQFSNSPSRLLASLALTIK